MIKLKHTNYCYVKQEGDCYGFFFNRFPKNTVSIYRKGITDLYASSSSKNTADFKTSSRRNDSQADRRHS